ncbi:hypothetical protein lbkm_3975 [Lachnospiraceae bacterium KM106-2]|nr:hypothetical protein lbkm_3975 [Lachnospiraceae bacterium KM106-2]
MNESYAEYGVKRANTPDIMIKKVLIIVAVLVSIFILPGISYFLVPVSLLVILFAIYMFPKFNVEWEYIFVDGQFDFDKIMGNSKRKTQLRIDFDQIEMIAPKGSSALDPFKNRNMKVKNFTSCNKGIKPYVIVGTYKEDMVEILFEPNDKMVECMRMKSPRKVMTY